MYTLATVRFPLNLGVTRCERIYGGVSFQKSAAFYSTLSRATDRHRREILRASVLLECTRETAIN